MERSGEMLGAGVAALLLSRRCGARHLIEDQSRVPFLKESGICQFTRRGRCC